MERQVAGSKFNPKAIEEKCSKAGISFWLASEVALALEGKAAATEEAFNELIMTELRKRDEAAARVFENYHKVYVRTSDGVLESFNKERIVQSMLRETTLPQNVCAEIAAEVESDIRRLELRYVSAPLIREMVNSKLLERRYLQAKNEYQRIGLPIFDVTQIIEKTRIDPPNPEALHKHFGDSVAEEYALVKLLPDPVSKAHLTGSIHIHDLPYFATRPVSLQNDMRWFLRHGLMTDGLGQQTSVAGPARRAEVAVSHAVRVMISGETHLSGGQSFDFFNNFLAPYTQGRSEKDVSQIIQSFLYELNQIYAVKGGQLPMSTLNFEVETPPFLKKEKAVLPKGQLGQDSYGDFEAEARRFLEIFLSTMAEGDSRGRPFAMPKVVLKVREGAIPMKLEPVIEAFAKENDLTILNLRGGAANRNMIAPNQILNGRGGKWFTTVRTGVLQEVSVNMPRIALSSRDDTEFFSQLDDALVAAKDAAKAKRDVIEKRLHKDRILPFLTQVFDNEEYYSLDNAPSIVNLVGLDNAVREYTGNDVGKSADALRFAEKTVAYVNSKMEGSDGAFIQQGCLEVKTVLARFARMNEKRFGVKDVYATRGLTHGTGREWLDREIALQSVMPAAARLEVGERKSAVAAVYDLLGRGAPAFTLKARV
jgi:ribonucleoside-triphosphate reductase